MKQEFIETGNTRIFGEICAEMTSSTSLIGSSLAMITGPAGRGKTEAAKHYAVNSDSIYIPPMNIRSPAMVLREIAFELDDVRPARSDTCLNIIGDTMAKKRRLIMIDEADLLSMDVLEMLRNVNERFACPVMLIGEEGLKGRVASRRRLMSRIRRRMEFGSINQQDINYFFRQSLGLKVNPEITVAIQKYCGGDWRPVLNVAIGIERSMKASDLKECTMELVNDVIKHA